MRNTPAASRRFDQLDTRHQLLHPEVQRRPPIAQQRGLRGDHIEVNVQTGSVAALASVR